MGFVRRCRCPVNLPRSRHEHVRNRVPEVLMQVGRELATALEATYEALAGFTKGFNR